MNTRALASEVRMSHWSEVIEERNASGLSVREYCKKSGIRENVYFYWQRKVREVACEELLTQVPVKISNTNEVIPKGWALCESAKNTKKALTIEVNNYRVLINDDFDTELLSKVCRVLVSLC